MKNFIKKYGRYLAILMVLALLLPIIVIAQDTIKFQDVKIEKANIEAENQTASDISNMTGVKIEEILKLRKEGISWNDILEKLKGKGQNTDDNLRRDNLLTRSGLVGDMVQKLQNEGFAEEDIKEAKLIVERIIFQLKEITEDSSIKIESPQVDVDSINNDADDIGDYEEILAKIDIDTAVYLLLKLRSDFGSFENVLDEYITSIQLNLNFEMYIADKEEYLKQKEDKKMSMASINIITIQKIEEKMLDKLNNENLEDEDESLTGTNSLKPVINEKESPLPDMSKPDISDIKPKNPADEIMNEIKVIDPLDR